MADIQGRMYYDTSTLSDETIKRIADAQTKAILLQNEIDDAEAKARMNAQYRPIIVFATSGLIYSLIAVAIIITLIILGSK